MALKDERKEGKQLFCIHCGKELPDGEYLCIDHDKKTGEVRGLLCKECNWGLGNFKDNPESLRKAIKYLEEKNGINKG